MELIYTYHPIWIFIALFLAFSYAYLFYRRGEVLNEISPALKWILRVFRFISVFIISILLLGIILENYKFKSVKPIIFIANDASESIIQAKDSNDIKNKLVGELNNLSNSLSEKFEVVNYSFGESVNAGFDSLFSHQFTDVSLLFNQIYNQYANRHVGAIILASDGIYNTGNNPIYTIDNKLDIPIYTIGLGDTTRHQDVSIHSITYNEIAFLGNQFPVEVEINQNDYKGKSVSIQIFEGNKKIANKNINFQFKDELIKSQFILNANNSGYRKYSVSVSELENEFTLKNNHKNFYIEVIDARQKILLTYSVLHPDISALNFALSQNKNYELSIKHIDELENGLNKYDLIIVHNFQNGNGELNQIIKTNSTPILNIIGANSNLSVLSKMNIGFSGSGNNIEDVKFNYNSDFSEIEFEKETIKIWESAPPLQAPIGDLNFSKSISTLASKKIGNLSINSPLLYFSQKNDLNYGVIIGEGIWKWRLFDQIKNQSTKRFEHFFSKIVNYIAIKENKDPFKIDIENEYLENESVNIKAQVYNAAYDLINTSNVSFKLLDESGKVFDYSFFKSENAYQLKLGKLPEGIYSWEAKTIISDKNYYKKGSFIVKAIQLESLTIQANHRLLKNLSSKTNGAFYLQNDLNLLSENLLNKEELVPITYQEKSFDDLIDYKWLFFLIVILLFVEWFIRKYQGGY